MAAGAGPEEQVRVQIIVAEVLARAAGGRLLLQEQVGTLPGLVLVPLDSCCLQVGEGGAVEGLDFHEHGSEFAGAGLAAALVGLVVDGGSEVGDAAVPADLFEVDDVPFAVQ